jgi:hypothetical protein
VKRRHSLSDWGLGVILAASTCTCAAGPTVDLPQTTYYDTRSIVSSGTDSGVTGAVLRAMQAAHPNEEGFCLYGQVERILPGAPLRTHLTITRVTLATKQWADSFRYARDTLPLSGCLDSDGEDPLVAIGHTHPYSVAPDCWHSPPDAYVLASDPRLLASVVFCGDGSGAVLLQDGRQSPMRWAVPVMGSP